MFTYYLTSDVSSPQVIMGKEKWLFYKTTLDGNPIADYEGTNRYSEGELNAVLKETLGVQNEIEGMGIRFAVVIPPNKENVYSEYMPDIYKHAEVSSTDILIDYLEERGVNIVSPKNAMLDKHLDMQLYYTYDTHWNQLGAYIGVKEILDKWGIPFPELSERKIFSSDLKDNYHYHAGDGLAGMAGLKSIFDDGVEYEVSGTKTMDWERYEKEQERGEVSHYVNDDAIVSGSVFIIGDSFRSSMLPALREAYCDVYVVHRFDYRRKMLEKIRPDYLIVEYVERYSREMKEISFLLTS